MLLADAHIKGAFREAIEEAAQPEAVRHGGRYGNDAAVSRRKRDKLFSQSRRELLFRFPAFADAVRLRGGIFTERMPISLARMNVQQHAPLPQGGLRLFQSRKQFAHVVPVDDPHIAKAEALKETDILCRILRRIIPIGNGLRNF